MGGQALCFISKYLNRGHLENYSETTRVSFLKRIHRLLLKIVFTFVYLYKYQFVVSMYGWPRQYIYPWGEGCGSPVSASYSVWAPSVGYQLFPVYCTASQPCISVACENAARLFTRRKQRRLGTAARNPRDLSFRKRKHELSQSGKFARCLSRQKQRRREFL